MRSGNEMVTGPPSSSIPRGMGCHSEPAGPGQRGAGTERGSAGDDREVDHRGVGRIAEHPDVAHPHGGGQWFGRRGDELGVESRRQRQLEATAGRYRLGTPHLGEPAPTADELAGDEHPGEPAPGGPVPQSTRQRFVGFEPNAKERCPRIRRPGCPSPDRRQQYRSARSGTVPRTLRPRAPTPGRRVPSGWWGRGCAGTSPQAP